MYKKFNKDDLLYNVVIANPKVKFTIFGGNVFTDFKKSQVVGDGNISINDMYVTFPSSSPPAPVAFSFDFGDPENSAYIAAF